MSNRIAPVLGNYTPIFREMGKMAYKTAIPIGIGVTQLVAISYPDKMPKARKAPSNCVTPMGYQWDYPVRMACNRRAVSMAAAAALLPILPALPPARLTA